MHGQAHGQYINTCLLTVYTKRSSVLVPVVEKGSSTSAMCIVLTGPELVECWDEEAVASELNHQAICVTCVNCVGVL